MTTHEPTPPTDLELMMLGDDALDAARRAEIEAFLSDDAGAEARGKLAGLRAVSALVGQSGAWPERAGFDVVDSLFAAIDAAPRRSGSAAPAAASRTTAANTTPPVRPANDNGRTIYALAFAAVAAAAALFVWGKAAPEGAELQATRAVAGDTTSSGTGPSGTGPSGAPSALAPAEPEAIARVEPAAEEPRYGVEVASVDFGQRTGAIYYVPAEGADAALAAVTTVVWLSDE